MQENLYQSPQSEFNDNLPPPKKPIAVWLFQILATVFIVIYLQGLIRVTILIFGVTRDWTSLTTTITWRTALCIALVFGIVGSQKKKLYGRTIGMIFIASIAIIGIVAQVIVRYKAPGTPPLPLDSARFVGEMTAYVVMLGLLGWWLYAFSFSEKARRYFSKDKDALLKVKA